MKMTKLIVAAAMFLLAFLGGPAHAAKELDCPPGPEMQGQRNETVMSEALVEKRRQARESDLARLRERFMRSTNTQAQPPAGGEQQVAR